MTDDLDQVTQRLVDSLMERAKELATLYRVEELFSDTQRPMPEILERLVGILPAGWQYPSLCRVAITYRERTFTTPGFVETPWVLNADIVVQESRVGQISVSYTREMPDADQGPFLKEEVQLLNTIAARIAQRLLHHRLRGMFEGATSLPAEAGELGQLHWRVVVDLLRKMDQRMLVKLSRRMLNLMVMRGIEEAGKLLQSCGGDLSGESLLFEVNQPRQRASSDKLSELCDRTFETASGYLADGEILEYIERWLNEDRSKFLTGTVATPTSTLGEISDAVERYLQLAPQGTVLPPWSEIGVRVELTRRLLGEPLQFINIAKKYFFIQDFARLMRRMIAPADSPGRLGGKSSGLLLAVNILEEARRTLPEIGEVRTPRTWFITSDGLPSFITLNNLEELFEHKYKSINEIRNEYPHIVQVFKSSQLPREIIKGLSLALEDFGEVPLVARSSSLLEDRLGHPFSGKYRSLFVANQGDKQSRLDSLADAITEVYASVFSPDPIEYRADHGLLDFNEEMGILLQEVVGHRVGKYWFPALAGVAFSHNEMRWSARVRRQDGLLRLVPGLGTRAVDRLTDDYPILIAVGQPELRVNVSPDEVLRYSPQSIDVINLETRTFQTKSFKELLEEVGELYPCLDYLLSLHCDGYISEPLHRGQGWWKDDVVVTFEGLIRRSGFIRQIQAILTVLQDALQTAVDIEFAYDDKILYLLQCRPQAHSVDDLPERIPTKVAGEDIVFSANRYISNGRVPELTHLVYVDPLRYSELASYEELREVGKAVGQLNKLLPRRKFALMGPGRWGSRGDIKLGVRVTYSDINNSAMLIEVARRKGAYVPDVSFGTHFFQDLVDSAIRYLPLFPDDAGVSFNERFLLRSPNALPQLLPEHAALADTLRVIDVRAASNGKILRVAMNADENRALGYLTAPGESP